MTKRLVPDPDLEALIERLNSAAKTADSDEPQTDDASEPLPGRAADPTVRARWSLPRPTDEGREWLARLLVQARRAQASDLLLVAGTPPTLRVAGRLVRQGAERLSDSMTGALCAAMVPTAKRSVAEGQATVDFAVSHPDGGRLRCNVHRERGRWTAAVRLLPSAVRDLRRLNLPESLSRFAELEHGLVLVTGPTGSGKSTTLAALIRTILARRTVHLITIEDPVEYEHAHGDSVVEHVEIGRDATTFPGALRAALRQDPDVLLIGEMRDPESISIAITAAETGHLVLSTLHTGDAPQTINRVVDSYPANQMEVVRVQLSVSLAAVVSQQLLPREDGAGRVPAVEILMATPAVRNLVRQGKIAQLRSQITLEQQAGMLSLDTSLARLVAAGLVDRAEARARSRVPDEFDQLLRRGIS